MIQPALRFPMASKVHKRVCYDKEYISEIECPRRSLHAASIARLGAVGIVPGAGFVHTCACVANGLERRMVREFRDGLEVGNAAFLEEVKARLKRYMFSQHIGAGVSLYVPNFGLVIYYNWAYTQRPMLGHIRSGQFVAPSDLKEVVGDFPDFEPNLVFPLPFGISGTTTTIGGLMGSTREAQLIMAARNSAIRGRFRGKDRHVCDVSVFVLQRETPELGTSMPCGCVATVGHVAGLRAYSLVRDREVMEGAKLDLDLTSFVRMLRRTGAALHWEPGMGALCLLSHEVVSGDVDIIFEVDSLCIQRVPPDSKTEIRRPSERLDSRIQRSYISALPTCRYLQYH